MDRAKSEAALRHVTRFGETIAERQRTLKTIPEVVFNLGYPDDFFVGKVNRLILTFQGDRFLFGCLADDSGDTRSIRSFELKLEVTFDPRYVIPFNSDFAEGISAEAQLPVLELFDLTGNPVTAPSMDRAGFQALRAAPQTIVGASLLIQAPTGDNDDFLDETRKQNPILSTEFHLIKRIRSGFWASLDANFYVGGRTSVSGNEQANLQRNSRLGATVVYPLKGRHAIRSSFSTGVVAESGGDFEMFTLSYIYAW